MRSASSALVLVLGCSFEPGPVSFPGEDGLPANDGAIDDSVPRDDGAGADAISADAPPDSMILHAVAGPVLVDGLADEWGALRPLPLFTTAHVHRTGSGYADSLEVAVAARHDAGQLYFFLSVQKDVVVTNSGELYDDDGFGLFFDTTPDGNPDYAQGGFVVNVRPRFLADDCEGWMATLDVSCAATRDDKLGRYAVEVRIALGPGGLEPAPALGGELGFTLVVRDDDGLANPGGAPPSSNDHLDDARFFFFHDAGSSAGACGSGTHREPWCDLSGHGRLLLDF